MVYPSSETGSIVERKRKDGPVSYRAPILMKSNGRIVHQMSSGMAEAPDIGISGKRPASVSTRYFIEEHQ